MTLEDLVELLGEDAVDGVETAVRDALEAAGHLDLATASGAVRELLLTMVSAVIITPQEGAEQRLEHDVGRLRALVAASLRARSS